MQGIIDSLTATLITAINASATLDAPQPTIL